jgi:two-component sensor histidine kinase
VGCEKSEIFNKLARAYISIDLQQAAEYANEGIYISKQSGCVKQLGDLYNSFSIICIYAGNNTDAFTYMDSAIVLYKHVDFKEGVAGVIGNKGSLYNNTGEFDKALDLQYQCLALYTELGNKSAVATTLTNMFIIFNTQHDFARAYKAISQAYELFVELDELDGKAMTTYNLAVLYAEMQKPDSCLLFSQQSVAFYQQLGNPDDIANGYSIYSIALRDNKDYTNALAYADSAITIYNSIGHERKYLEALQYKAENHFYLEQYELSIAVAKKIAEESARRELKQIECNAAKLLMDNYTATGDYKNALDYSKRYHALEQEMLNENSISEINRLKSEFDFERKELELETAVGETKILELELNKKNAYLISLVLIFIFGFVIIGFILKQRQLTTQQKTAQLEHKALRTQMNPHFIFNSLNSIQRMYVEGNMDEANEFTADFAELMRRILDNSTKNLVTLHEEIELLTLYLSLENMRCKNMFDFTFDVEEKIDSQHTLIPPLIIQPFVENAIWHGILPKRQRGRIKIELRRENKFLRCTVEDNGIGIQKKSTHFHESHGMRITEQRIGSKVKIESESGVGTKVTFYILYQTV